VELVQVWTEHQVADLFTKSLSKTDFERLRDTLMSNVPFAQMVASHRKEDSNVAAKVNQVYRKNENVKTKGVMPFVVPIEDCNEKDCYSIGSVILGLDRDESRKTLLYDG
jgi:hypothetical protein